MQDDATAVAGDGPLRGATLTTPGHRLAAPTMDQVREAAEHGELVWLDLVAPDPGALAGVVELLGLPGEVVADSTQFGQRTQASGDGASLRVFMYAVDDDDRLDELHLYVTGRHLLSVRRGPMAPVDRVLDGRRPVGDAVTAGALLARLMSETVGTFSTALQRLDEQLAPLERDATTAAEPGFVRGLMALRGRVNGFRRVVDPARDLVGVGRYVMIDALGDLPDDTRRQLRDLALDLAYVSDRLEAERDRIATLMDVHLAEVNIRQNETMKRLAAVSTLFLPLTFLTGFFGMNFGFLVRQVRSPAAFLALGLGLNVVVAALALGLLWRRGWLGATADDPDG